MIIYFETISLQLQALNIQQICLSVCLRREKGSSVTVKDLWIQQIQHKGVGTTLVVFLNKRVNIPICLPVCLSQYIPITTQGNRPWFQLIPSPMRLSSRQ